MSAFLKALSGDKDREAELGGQMSFLEHLDELRRRLVRCFVVVILAGAGSWFVSEPIYFFLAAPIERALAEVQRQEVPIAGYTGAETISGMQALKENDTGRFVFPRETKIGTGVIPTGTSVMSKVLKDSQGKLELFTDEALYAGNAVIPKGVRLPIDLATAATMEYRGENDRLIVTTALEAFSLYIKVALYTAIAISVPFLLLQIWGFVSPGLYPHERAYVTPFIVLSSISFVLGAAFAYYILFRRPPSICWESDRDFA
jgi:sec-independent protein translocase protein TatC